MSHHFRELKEGDYLSVKGPKVHILYFGGYPLVKQCITYTWMLVSNTVNSVSHGNADRLFRTSVMYTELTP